MSTPERLRQVEKKLEVAIKSAFEKVIREDGDFEISADYDTHLRINDVVEGLDLEVYGMSVTPSQFTITFEFRGSFENINSKERPRHCNIRLENDGDYYLTLTESDFQKDWFLGITDINFNLRNVPEDVMLDCLTQFEDTLLIKILSN